MADRDPRKKPADSMPKPDIHPRPVAGHDEQPPDANTREGGPERKRRFQKRLAEKVDQSLKEHPDGSAPPLDRLTQDLDPNKDL
jgi:hypothetical protein